MKNRTMQPRFPREHREFSPSLGSFLMHQVPAGPVERRFKRGFRRVRYYACSSRADSHITLTERVYPSRRLHRGATCEEIFEGFERKKGRNPLWPFDRRNNAIENRVGQRGRVVAQSCVIYEPIILVCRWYEPEGYTSSNQQPFFQRSSLLFSVITHDLAGPPARFNRASQFYWLNSLFYSRQWIKEIKRLAGGSSVLSIET